MKIETTATFIGHNECMGVSTDEIKSNIIKLINHGVTDFISGGQGGFDRLCARCVYEIKKEYKEITNNIVIPYLTFKIFDKTIFDEIIYPEGFEKYYFKSAIPARNKYLINNSNYAICYVVHNWGGAAKTYAMAKKKKINIIDLSNSATKF